MTRTIIKSQIGTDGVLHLDIPMGMSEAGRQVQITIEPDAIALKAQQDHRDFLDATAGAWQGDFERPEQGEYETRDPL